MMRTTSAMVRSVTAMVAAVGSLVCLAGPAEAFDSGTCNNIFTYTGVRAETFKIDTGAVGKVDFGDHLHLGGAPQGTAVVCWALSGQVAVVGRLFIDTSSEIIIAEARITYYRGDVVESTSVHSLTGNNNVSKLVNEKRTGGVFTRVRLRLYRNQTLVHTKTITR